MLDVQVIHNKTHTAFAGLQAKDFDLSEDGTPQKILFFSRDDRLPLSVVLLFDLTKSDRRILRRLGASAQKALEHLKPNDEVAVMVYAASARLIDGFTLDRRKTSAAIAHASTMASNDAAFFNEALYQAAAQLEVSANPSGRRVILWLTDNMPNLPTDYMLRERDEGLNRGLPHTEAQAIHKLNESSAVVMPLLLRDRLWLSNVTSSDRKEYAREHRDDKDYPPGDAYKYAEITGGFVFKIRGENVQERLAQIIDSIRTRYTIGYRPSQVKPPGTFCRVNVALASGAPLRPQEWSLLTREGYYRK